MHVLVYTILADNYKPNYNKLMPHELKDKSETSTALAMSLKCQRQGKSEKERDMSYET